MFDDLMTILPKSGDKTRAGRKVCLEVGFGLLGWHDTVSRLPGLSFGQRDFDHVFDLKSNINECWAITRFRLLSTPFCSGHWVMRPVSPETVFYAWRGMTCVGDDDGMRIR